MAGDLATFLAGLSPDPHVRSRQFERACKWLLEEAPEYRPFVRRVWLWDDWPERWGIDAGIDLVVETTERTLWAVQAKLYDENYSVRKSDVDTFLSESATSTFVFRLLIATTDRLASAARRAIDHQEKSVGLRLLSDLQRMDVAWPATIAALAPAPRRRKEPWPHCLKAVDEVVTGLQDYERGQVVMACGTGKTLVGLWTAEALAAKRTLVAVPSLSLLSQTIREWTSSCRDEISVLPVCSDETVVDEDDFTQHVSELGVPATTSPAEIKKFLERPRLSVVISTYQSLPRVAEAQRLGAPIFDLAIADEAHRCVGPLHTDFALILNGTAIRAERRLFMTATPRFLTSGKKGEKRVPVVGRDFASMDDEGVFGPVLHRLPFSKAIAEGLLADYQVAVIGVDSESVYEHVDRRSLLLLPDVGTYDAAALATQIGLLKAIRQWDLRRIITFHNRVARARMFSNSLARVMDLLPEGEQPPGALWAGYVSGLMSAGDRLTRLRRLASASAQTNERAVISNARCLSEGIDVPALDGVAFIDPRSSQVDVVQAVGRAIRRSPEKRIGTVILPVVIPSGADDVAILDSSAFRPVWEVLRALRAHDDDLGIWLDAVRRQLGRGLTGPIRFPDKIIVDLPDGLSREFVDAFYVRLVRETTPAWDEFIGAAEKFSSREGHLDVPGDHIENRLALGEWLLHQRRQYRAGILPVARRRALEQLPGWTASPTDDRWNRAYKALLQFVAREGHPNPLPGYKEDGFHLGNWVSKQRAFYAVDRHITEERISRLEAIPGWSWSVNDDIWERYCDALQSYFERLGTARVPPSYVTDDGKKLGAWVARQRLFYRQGRLASDRIDRLERFPDWRWRVTTRPFKKGPSPNQEAQWQATYDLVKRYAEQHGTCVAPRDYVASNGAALYEWMKIQRSQLKLGKLTDRRRALLESLPGWSWSMKDDRWQNAFQHLKQYCERTGTARVPNEYRDDDGFLLGAWVRTNRRRYLMSQLESDRIKALEALPGWVWRADRAQPPSTEGARRHTVVSASDHMLVLLYRKGDVGATTPELVDWAEPSMKHNAYVTLQRLLNGGYLRREGNMRWITDSGKTRVQASGLLADPTYADA